MSKAIVCICEICGKAFSKYVYGPNDGQYCSSACYGESKKLGPNEFFSITDSVICISLTQGRFALVDALDYPKVAAYRWFSRRKERTYYACANMIRADGLKRAMLMHRWLLKAPPDMVVDHVDGNGLNNSSLFGTLNIRVATIRQNSQNRLHPKTSRFPGVSWIAKDKRWRAGIQYKKRAYGLGNFESEEDAYAAYCAACAAIGATILPRY